MNDYHSWTGFIIFIILVLSNTIMFGFGAAIKNINETCLEKSMEDGDKKARLLLKIINRPTKFINTIQVVSILSSYIIGDYLLGNFSYNFRILVYLLALTLHLSIGIIVPKYIAKTYPKNFAYISYSLINILIFIFTPLVFIVNLISHLILRLFSINSYSESDGVTEEDILSMVNEGHEQGILETREAMMISNIFELNDKTASDIMTNRKNLVCLDADKSLSDIVDFMLNEGINSRYPVYEEDIDNIIGLINMKDALIYLRKTGNRSKKLSEIKGLIRKVEFVLETKNLDELFKEMQANRLHLVVVIDEYAQTQGIVTLEDILEEIVGNILDEYDLEEDNIVKNNDGTYIVKGMCSLGEFSETLNFEFDEEDFEEFDTINGFIINKLGRLPIDNDNFKIFYKNLIFECKKVDNKFIESLKLSFNLNYEEEKENND